MTTPSFGCGGHFQLGRYFAGVYGQRVIARDIDRPRQASKNGLSIVGDCRALAVERNRSTHGGATGYFIDALMAETDAQNARCASAAARMTSYAFEEIIFSESVMLTQPFVLGKQLYRNVTLSIQ